MCCRGSTWNQLAKDGKCHVHKLGSYTNDELFVSPVTVSFSVKTLSWRKMMAVLEFGDLGRI